MFAPGLRRLLKSGVPASDRVLVGRHRRGNDLRTTSEIEHLGDLRPIKSRTRNRHECELASSNRDLLHSDEDPWLGEGEAHDHHGRQTRRRQNEPGADPLDFGRQSQRETRPGDLRLRIFGDGQELAEVRVLRWDHATFPTVVAGIWARPDPPGPEKPFKFDSAIRLLRSLAFPWGGKRIERSLAASGRGVGGCDAAIETLTTRAPATMRAIAVNFRCNLEPWADRANAARILESFVSPCFTPRPAQKLAHDRACRLDGN